MAKFIEHCKAINDISAVERCLLHMDVTIMDFDSILSLLKHNHMYSALCFVYTHGLKDFITPLETFFEALFKNWDNYNNCDNYDDDDVLNDTYKRRIDGKPQSYAQQFGYKALLFLRYSFLGYAFPRGKEGVFDNIQIQKNRADLLKFLILPNLIDKHMKYCTFGQQQHLDFKTIPYPYLHMLILVDTKVLLDVLSVTFDASDSIFDQTSQEYDNSSWSSEPLAIAQLNTSSNDNTTSYAANQESAPVCPSRQLIVKILSSIIIQSNYNTPSLYSTPLDGTWQELSAKNAFLDFVSKYLQKGVIHVPNYLILQVLTRITSVSTYDAQQQLIALLNVLPHSAYDHEDALLIIEKAGFTRAALSLHQFSVSRALKNFRQKNEDSLNVDLLQSDPYQFLLKHFVASIDSFIKDDDSEFCVKVFGYIRQVFIEASLEGNENIAGDGATSKYKQFSSCHEALRRGICDKISDLILLDSIKSSQLIADTFEDDLDEVMNSFVSVETIRNNEGANGETQFKFLHAIISGDLSKVDSIAGQILTSNLTMDHYKAYLELMAKYHPQLVYQYLSTHDGNYRPKDCLNLCQVYKIADASAYLLERMGNVSSALQLMLQT